MLTLTQRETEFVMQKNSRGEGRCRILIRKTKAQICAKRSISELPITICDTSGDRRRNLRFSGQPTNDNEGKTPTMEFYLIVTMRPALCTEGWRRCHRVLKNEKKLARMDNQVQLKNHRTWPVYKFGIQVPRSHEEAMWINERNNSHGWAESEKLDISQLDKCDSLKDLGDAKTTPIPEGCTKIPCHFVYDVKHDGRLKSRFCGGRALHQDSCGQHKLRCGLPGWHTHGHVSRGSERPQTMGH